LGCHPSWATPTNGQITIFNGKINWKFPDLKKHRTPSCIWRCVGHSTLAHVVGSESELPAIHRARHVVLSDSMLISSRCFGHPQEKAIVAEWNNFQTLYHRYCWLAIVYIYIFAYSHD
jgi:hypothetical protein